VSPTASPAPPKIAEAKIPDPAPKTPEVKAAPKVEVVTAAPAPAATVPAKAAVALHADEPEDTEELQLEAAIKDTEYQDEADEEDEDDDM